MTTFANILMSKKIFSSAAMKTLLMVLKSLNVKMWQEMIAHSKKDWNKATDIGFTDRENYSFLMIFQSTKKLKKINATFRAPIHQQ